MTNPTPRTIQPAVIAHQVYRAEALLLGSVLGIGAYHQLYGLMQEGGFTEELVYIEAPASGPSDWMAGWAHRDQRTVSWQLLDPKDLAETMRVQREALQWLVDKAMTVVETETLS